MANSDIQHIYDFLEESVTQLSRVVDVSFKLKDMVSEIENKKLLKHINWEIDSLQFIISEGSLKPNVLNTGSDGSTILEYPSHGNFSENTYKYFLKRAGCTNNIYLKIRYNQIVWDSHSSMKHDRQPKEIIDQTITFYKELDGNYKKKETEIDELLKNAIVLSFSINNYRYKGLISVIKSIIASEKGLNIYSKVGLITLIDRFKSKFTNEDLSFIIEHSITIYEELLQENDSIWIENLTTCAYKIANKLGLNTKLWLNKQAHAFENFADYRMDDKSRMIPLLYLKKAIQVYKKAGNRKEVERLGVKYSELSNELKLQKVKFNPENANTRLLSDLINNHVDWILSGDPNSIYLYLSSSNCIFPSKKYILENIKNNGVNFVDVASLIEFDINSNIGKSGIASDRDKFYDNYRLHLIFYTINLLNELFRKGVKQRKITFNTFVEYLNKRSWLGQNLYHFENDGERKKYKWLNLIAPSILELFIQYESAMLSKSFYSSFILCLDSLTLKFEGILRDYFKRKHINTITSTRSGTREMYIDDFLNHDKVLELFHEDDLTYFKYIFTSRGMNIRNNIAHSFYKPSNYSYIDVLLVFVAILRVSNYELVEVE